MSKERLLRITRQQRDLSRLVIQQQDDLDQFLVEHRECCTSQSKDMKQLVDALQNLGGYMTATNKGSHVGEEEEFKKSRDSIVESDGGDTISEREDENQSRNNGQQAKRPIALSPSPPRHYEPRGLLRQHNTCYINVVLQALAALDPYKLEEELGDIVGEGYRMTRSADNEPGKYKMIIMPERKTKLNIGWEFLDLLKKLRQEGVPIHPYALQFTVARKLCLPTLGPSQGFKFDGKKEEDAEDFYSSLLNCLRAKWKSSDILDRLLLVGTSEVFTRRDTGESKIRPSLEEWKLIQYPPERLTTTVAEAMYRGAKVPERSVIELLQHNSTFFVGEYPEGFENDKATKALRFTKVPEFLMIQFCRCGMTDNKDIVNDPDRPKLAYRVKFDDNDYTIDLSSIDPHAVQLGCLFRLRTVIYHCGTTFSTGHYLAVTRTEQNRLGYWYECNDDLISNPLTGPYPMNGEDYAQAYLALYEKIPQNVKNKETRCETDEEDMGEETEQGKLTKSTSRNSLDSDEQALHDAYYRWISESK